MSYKRGNQYKFSTHKAICDICGKLRNVQDLLNAYGTGDIAVVVSCKDGCADYRHPLNSPPPLIFDGQPVKDPRPEGGDSFINPLADIYKWGTLPKGKNIWGQMNIPNNAFNFDGLWVMGFWGNFDNMVL